MKPESLLARCRLARFPTSRSGKQPWPRSWVAAFRASDREDREEGKSRSPRAWRWVGEGRAGVWGCCCGTATADAHNYPPPPAFPPTHKHCTTTHNTQPSHTSQSLPFLSLLSPQPPPSLPRTSLHPTLKGASSNGPPVRSSAPTPAPARSSAGAPPPSTPPRRRPPSAGAHLA